MRRVAEDNDAQEDGEVLEVETPLDFAPTPLRQFEQAVAEDNGVDDQVRHGAPETQQRNHVQTLQEGQRYQKDAADHHPGAGIDWTLGERAHLANNSQGYFD